MDSLVNKVRETADRLLPFNKKQERIFPVLYYMNQYGGLDFIKWLYDHYTFTDTVLEIRND